MCLAVGVSTFICSQMTRARGVKSAPFLFILAIILSVLSCVSGFAECGDFYALSVSDTGQITSPDYPNMYPIYSKCIWLIESPSDLYRVRLTLTYQGERYNGSCSDYVEVRDGSQYAPVVGIFCDNATNEVVTSGYRWLWVLFKSDGITGSGSVMTAVFSAYHNSTLPSNTTKPFSECRSYEFECRNKMCSSLSYRCDDYNDCGCKDDCDEDGCFAIGIQKGIQIGISIAVGVFTFLCVALISFIIEGRNSWNAAVSEANREKETRDAERRRRVSKAVDKFIGETTSTFTPDTTNNAQRAPPAAASNKLAGPMNTLTVQPKNAPFFKVSEMTVTDIEA